MPEPKFENQAPTQDQDPDIEENYARIMKSLGLTEEDIHDKVVLDSGACEGEFGQYVNDMGIAKVVSLDVNKPENGNNEFLQAEAQNLPLAEESIDLMVSLGGAFNMAQSREELDQMVEEAMRVLKKGGEARIGMGWNVNVLPTPEADIKTEDRMRHFREKWLELYESYGFSEVEEKQVGEGLHDYYLRMIK